MKVYEYIPSPTEQRSIDNGVILPATALIAKIKAIDAGCDAVSIGNNTTKIKKADHEALREAFQRHLANMQVARKEQREARAVLAHCKDEDCFKE